LHKLAVADVYWGEYGFFYVGAPVIRV